MLFDPEENGLCRKKFVEYYKRIFNGLKRLGGHDHEFKSTAAEGK